MSKLNIKTIEEELKPRVLIHSEKDEKTQKVIEEILKQYWDAQKPVLKAKINQIFDICVGEEKEVSDAVVCRSEGYNKKRAEIIQLKEEFNN